MCVLLANNARGDTRAAPRAQLQRRREGIKNADPVLKSSKMKLHHATAVLLLLQQGHAQALALTDAKTNAAYKFDTSSQPTFGELTSLTYAGGDNLIAAHGGTAVWSGSFVTSHHSAPVQLDSRTVAATRSHSATPNQFIFSWALTAGADQPGATVELTVNLVNGQLEYTSTVTGISAGSDWALWEWQVTPVGALALPKGSTLFENAGFGLTHSPPTAFSGLYPQHTMQFMATYGLGDGSSGVYVAAHDTTAASKTFLFSPAKHLLGSTGAFAVSAIVLGAGVPGSSAPTWPVVVRVFEGGWWDASQIYRSWVLAHGSWTKQGPMITRDDLPPWLYNLTTWVNSHWQQNDIFNISGGDPAVTANRVGAIAERFGLAKDSLALHWYEWDTLGYKEGSNYTECATEVTCGFDTHYPEYFPVRQGFQSALKTMQDLGVRVAPYINGRIFDKGTKSWTATAQAAAAKQAAVSIHADDLSLYDESYGSLAKFAVMCPHTALWQQTIAKVVGELTNAYGTDGVYIDQIAAAGPRPCWDKTHDHTLGGGDHWVTGYAEMLRQARVAAGGKKILLTESNSEPFMAGINLFLTLVGFATGDLPGGTGATVMVPAFQAVYGGYVLPVGAEFFRNDFLPDPNVFAAKIAAQYVFGAQLGWFSLGGRDNQHPAMGIHDLLMDGEYDDEVFYLRALSKAKRLAAPWFNHGRMMRPLTLKLNGSDSGPVSILEHPRRGASQSGSRLEEHDHEHDVSTGSDTGIGFGAVMASAWQNHANSSLLVTFTATKRATPIFSLQTTLDLAEYGFGPRSHSKTYSVYEVVAGPDGHNPASKIGSFPGAKVDLHMVLGVRGVALLRIEEEKKVP